MAPFGQPEQTLRHETTIAHLLRIPEPFGRGSDAILMVTADRGTEDEALNVIALSIVSGIRIEPLDLDNLQSNPRRYDETEEGD